MSNTSTYLHLHSSITSSTKSAVRQTKPQSNVASTVLSNVLLRIYSKWSSSTTCWEFFHQFLSAITLKLIQIFLTKIQTLSNRTISMINAICCYGINLCWYPVLSILASYKYEHFRLFVDFPYQKNINIGQHLLKLFENFVGVWVFLNHSVEYKKVYTRQTGRRNIY